MVPSGGYGIWGYDESFPTASNQRRRRFYWEGAINYNQTFGNHEITGLVLGNLRKTFYLNPSRNNFPEIPTGSMGIVGRVTYNYLQKYLFEANAGYNGSENFAPGKRFGLFPSASAGWILSEEVFFKNNIEFVTFLKLRASIGKVGSDNVLTDRFLYFPDAWNPNVQGYVYGNSQSVVSEPRGARELRIGNPNVTWETAVKQNYGIDMTFFNSRLSVNLDRFFEKRRDILEEQKTIPAFVSVDMPRTNLGKVDNHGYEISMKWRNQIGANKQNSYWVGGNVSYARNKIVFKDEVPNNYEWNNETGHRVGQNFGYVFERLYRPEDFPLDLITDNELGPGDAKYSDLNTDDKIDASDITAIGYSRYPDYIFSFNAGFSYKGFDFSMLWQGATNVSRNLTGMYRTPFGQLGNRALLLYHFENRYVNERVTPNAKLPRFDQNMRAWNYQGEISNSLWVADASYIRLKNVEIGYRLPVAYLKRIGIQNMRVSLTGSNLLTIDNLLFIDPEESGNNSQYPNIATINFGVSFSF
jgi:TonB-linked SusC/RagA family outer membrane protein